MSTYTLTPAPKSGFRTQSLTSSLLLSFLISAAAAAKSRQLCPTLCEPIDGSPPRSAIPGILQARTLEWVAISFSNAGYTSALLQMVKQMLGFYHTIWSQEGKHKHGS